MDRARQVLPILVCNWGECFIVIVLLGLRDVCPVVTRSGVGCLSRSLGLAVAPRIRFLKKVAGKSTPAAAAAGSADEQDSGIDESRRTADARPAYKPLFRTAYSFHDGESGVYGPGDNGRASCPAGR